MAKKISDKESVVSETQVQTQEIPPTTEPKPEPVKEGPSAPQSVPEKAKTESDTFVIPDYADRILRLYPNDKELYIDPHGGTYTSDTPSLFRSTATLYRNPYYRKL